MESFCRLFFGQVSTLLGVLVLFTVIGCQTESSSSSSGSSETERHILVRADSLTTLTPTAL